MEETAGSMIGIDIVLSLGTLGARGSGMTEKAVYADPADCGGILTCTIDTG
jgi:hypothetical protein